MPSRRQSNDLDDLGMGGSCFLASFVLIAATLIASASARSLLASASWPLWLWLVVVIGVPACLGIVASVSWQRIEVRQMAKFQARQERLKHEQEEEKREKLKQEAEERKQEAEERKRLEIEERPVQEERERKERERKEREYVQEKARKKEERRLEHNRQQRERRAKERKRKEERERLEEEQKRQEEERLERDRKERERRVKERKKEEKQRRERAKQLEKERAERLEEMLQRDRFMDRINCMAGSEFERFMADFFREQGYVVHETPGSGDQGIDLLLDMEGRKIAVQLKRWTGAVGNRAVQETFAGMFFYKVREAWLITTSFFTRSAIEAAKENGVRLVDGEELAEWLKAHRDEK